MPGGLPTSHRCLARVSRSRSPLPWPTRRSRIPARRAGSDRRLARPDDRPVHFRRSLAHERHPGLISGRGPARVRVGEVRRTAVGVSPASSATWARVTPSARSRHTAALARSAQSTARSCSPSTRHPHWWTQPERAVGSAPSSPSVTPPDPRRPTPAPHRQPLPNPHRPPRHHRNHPRGRRPVRPALRSPGARQLRDAEGPRVPTQTQLGATSRVGRHRHRPGTQPHVHRIPSCRPPRRASRRTRRRGPTDLEGPHRRRARRDHSTTRETRPFSTQCRGAPDASPHTLRRRAVGVYLSGRQLQWVGVDTVNSAHRGLPRSVPWAALEKWLSAAGILTQGQLRLTRPVFF